MLYVEHNQLRTKYILVQMQYDAILSEQEALFARTQPAGINYAKERATGGNPTNPFDEYITAKEQKRIDERLKEIKSILDDRKELLDLKERELRLSKEWDDIIYTYYFLDRLTITQIEIRLPYSRVQIWRKLNKIKDNLNGTSNK